MEEAETLCDRIAIVDHGKIIAAGTLAELRGMVGERDTVRLSGRFDPARAREALAQVAEAEIVQAEEGELRLALSGASQKLPQLFAALSGAGAEVRETIVTRPSLESVFIHLTGKELRE
jgi:ABC-2 type transport system ATP-binding protein